MNFLELIFNNLANSPEKTILQEVRDGRLIPLRSRELQGMIQAARLKLRTAGLKAGERCALLGENSCRWIALDLAIMAEGAIAVPLYHRHTPAEITAMLQDCTPHLICCASEELLVPLKKQWPEVPAALLYQDIWPESEVPFSPTSQGPLEPQLLSDSSEVVIFYTSGTSGDAKGVVLNAGNISFILERTASRLTELMQDTPKEGDDRVFHWAPFCYTSSSIVLWTCLRRNNCLTLSTNLQKMVEELQVARPHYFFNVPALLERIRNGILAKLQQKGRTALALFCKGEAAWKRQQSGKSQGFDFLWAALAHKLVFSKIKNQIGPDLRALICGSAPLSEETQQFFQMVGIPVLQVYGLTETTGICTMDDVYYFKSGFVGPAIRGIEMRLGKNDEILVKGPNVFPRYWNRPEATAEVLQNGWFHTGDQGTVNATGNWKIIGRIKNLIIPASGHNIAPEPIEQLISNALPDAKQIVLVGNGRKYLAAIITGNLEIHQIQEALDRLNSQLPHYKQVRRFHHCPEPFTPESGLVTAKGTIRRAVIESHFKDQIDLLYAG
jgi:long-chain acyl-CoA synthetase